jgi:trans-2,3-dihydro-3-hydroxyanthranilate isomerase
VIIPLKDLESLKRSRTNRDKYFELIEEIDSRVLLAFAPGEYEPGQSLGVRVFVDYFGIPEDPATGSANGCLAGYLTKHRYFGTDHIDIAVGQGYEIQRPSTLFLQTDTSGDGINVYVGGRVAPVAEGYFGES